MPKIWGIYFEIIFSDDFQIWKLFINSPFMEADGRYRIGIGIKLLREAIDRNVNQFILVVGQKEITMGVPSEEEIKKKEKEKEFEDIPSMFKGSSPMRIYFFYI